MSERTGTDAGEGYNINIPMPAGSGEGAYLAASSFLRCVGSSLT
jgi:acetoin utilization deacetylase AcuC-like enzyme